MNSSQNTIENKDKSNIDNKKPNIDELELLKYKAKEEINTLVDSYKNTLSELDKYKWALRFIFVALLGGSIFGVMKAQDYIDNRIAHRVEKMDRLYFAVSLANTQQWRDSLVEFDVLWEDFKSTSFKPTNQYKSFYYLNLIWVLSNLEEYLPNGSIVGQPQWDRLQEDNDFIREFMTSNQWENSSTVNNNLGLCLLKYDKKDKTINSIKNYFQKSYDVAKTNIEKAANIHGLSVIDIIENKKNHATEKIREAAKLNPAVFNPDIYKTNLEYYFDSTEFKSWNKKANSLGKLNLRQEYASIFDELTKPKTKNSLR